MLALRCPPALRRHARCCVRPRIEVGGTAFGCPLLVGVICSCLQPAPPACGKLVISASRIVAYAALSDQQCRSSQATHVLHIFRSSRLSFRPSARTSCGGRVEEALRSLPIGDKSIDALAPQRSEDCSYFPWTAGDGNDVPNPLEGLKFNTNNAGIKR